MSRVLHDLRASSPRWSSIAPAVLLLAAAVWLFRRAATGMVDIWLISATFTHGFLVPPIVAWLVWRRRATLSRIPLVPSPSALVPIAAACLLWLVGEVAEVNAAMHFALVAIIVLLVPALFGWALARELAFPLLFLFFAVPFGDFTVPYLQQWTADVTVAALRATGIPVYRDGMQFIIPSGTWSVIEACSGVRYLIASVMVGTLFAYLNYQRTAKRVAFMAASIVVPIFANWIRAYTIVMIGHVTGSPMILGFEHTTYGWWLFGLIVALMFAAGARWADPEPAVQAHHATSGDSRTARAAWSVALATLVLLLGVQGIAAYIERVGPTPSVNVHLPAGQGGWQDDAGYAGLPWAPAYAKANAVAQRGYQSSSRKVAVWTAFYTHQSRDRRLVSSTNHVVESENKFWAYQADRVPKGLLSGREFEPAVGTVRRGASPSLQEVQRLRVWHLYWIGGRWTSSPARAKVWHAYDRLRGEGDDGAAILLVTPLSADSDDVLADFARSHLDSISKGLSEARDRHRVPN